MGADQSQIALIAKTNVSVGDELTYVLHIFAFKEGSLLH